MNKWLTFAQAAELLEVDVRTIKRWVTHPAIRDALGVVRHYRQWKIPRPDYSDTWVKHTRRRLKSAGVPLRPSWEMALEKLARQNDRYLAESYRLWMAAFVKALQKGRVTQMARENMFLLWQTACKVLNLEKKLKRSEMDVEKLKSHFPPKLRQGGLSVKSIMHHWPKQEHFKQLRKADTKADFEKIRRALDFWQAYRDEFRRRRGKEPTAENLCPLLHKDLITHINDTREEPSSIGAVVKNPTPGELRAITMASVQNQIQGKPPPRVLIDFRQPQKGISLRTFRTRYPRSKQQSIIAMVRRILSAPPDVEERPHTGKTPVRDSTSRICEQDG